MYCAQAQQEIINITSLAMSNRKSWGVFLLLRRPCVSAVLTEQQEGLLLCGQSLQKSVNRRFSLVLINLMNKSDERHVMVAA